MGISAEKRLLGIAKKLHDLAQDIEDLAGTLSAPSLRKLLDQGRRTLQ